MNSLGKKQKAILRSLHEYGSWRRGCGWIWDTPRGTEKLLDSLVRRGFVTVSEADVHGRRTFCPALRVAVIDEESATNPGERHRIVAQFATVKEAENYIGKLPDKAKVERGGYGIDAPEELTNG